MTGPNLFGVDLFGNPIRRMTDTHNPTRHPHATEGSV